MSIAKLPSYPLITHDPFFSIWHSGNEPAQGDTVHWSGVRKILGGQLWIDGVQRRFLGRRGKQAMKMTGLTVTPLSTRYTMEALGVRLVMSFTSPLLPDDLDVLSTPVSFVDFSVESTDGAPHEVKLCFQVNADLCHSGEEEPEMRQDFFEIGALNIGYMGRVKQMPLSGCGDRLTMDWGHVFLASEDEVDGDPQSVHVLLQVRKTARVPFTSHILVGYDDLASINYFGRLLPAYYARNGKSIVDALLEFSERREEILERCRAFDERVLEDAFRAGGEKLQEIACAAFRQSVAGHKLVEGPDGELLFISKENDSNGCAATVDVSYPSSPLYLLYAPELVRAMCRPVFRTAKMPAWHYDFAPHDAGRYPILYGQQYGSRYRAKHQQDGNSLAPYYLYPSGANLYFDDKQMPLEESADMILMLAAAGKADGDYRLAGEELPLLRRWCHYLITHGEIPANQLCTDDFAGHLDQNVNLSAKAFLGVAAFSEILKALGETEEAEECFREAKRLSESWRRRAGEAGKTYLTFRGDSWSIKYNLVWDKLFGWGFLPGDFYEKEVESYLRHQNAYGLPLDGRSSIGKTDWILWTAALGNRRQAEELMAPVLKYLHETPTRVPFSDFYDTETGASEWFIARTVQGGIFMPVLMDRWTKEKE